MALTRRRFIPLLIIFAASVLQAGYVLPETVPNVNPEPVKNAGVGGDFAAQAISDFLDEKLEYEISFLWFKKAATGSASFSREGDGYKAVLQAETRGFVGFVTGHRKHIYVSHMKFDPEKKKLRSYLFERFVTIRKREEKTLNWVDYKQRSFAWKDYKKGDLVDEGVEPIPKGVEYEDILSAYYNFRLGVFGPAERGRKFQVNTIPEKGESVIGVNITSEEEAEQSRKLFGSGYDEDLMHIKVRVPRVIFRSKKGEVDVWVGGRMRPVKGIVRDYIGFGDIRCALSGWDD
ncbi:MAG: DUF3108 domain-containing protein [Proteobacteria bacterium]|nr:DUF3108 domain-containing protein [Pseudomonadota bacterium]